MVEHARGCPGRVVLLALWLLALAAGPSLAQAADVALFTNRTFVQYQPGSTSAEASNMLASLRAHGHQVVGFSALEAVRLAPVLDAADAVVIPELETSATPPLVDALDGDARALLAGFVEDGGVLVVAGDAGGRGLAVVNALFGWQVAALATAPTTFSRLEAARGHFDTVPSPLPRFSATRAVDISTLPPGAEALFANGNAAAAVLLPYGRGHVVLLGWDWFSAAPVGAIDSGWLALLSAAVTVPPSGLVSALFTGGGYVDHDPADPAAEASNVERTLLGIGSGVAAFETTSAAALATALGGTSLLAIPELEANPGTAFADTLDEAARDVVRDFVNGGGVLLVFADGGQQSHALLDDLFAITPLPGSAAASFSLDPVAAAGTAFASGAGVLPSNNGTRTVTAASLPANARALYRNGTDVALWVMPVGDGWVAYAGWDWFDAAPLGVQDGGWIDALRAVATLAAPSPRVALLGDSTYVEYIPGNDGAEASNMEQSLLNLGADVNVFTGVGATALSAALAGRQALVIPDLERAPATSFTDALDPAARSVLTDYVEDGGVLVVVADAGNRSETLLGALFGFSLVRGTAAASYPLNAAAAAGSPFASLVGSIGPTNATRPPTVASLPVGARAIYRNQDNPATDTAAVWAVPVGRGWVAYFGWDWFDAAPVGAEDGGLLDVLGAVIDLGRSEGEVALLANPVYVDYVVGGGGAEAYTMEQSALNLGWDVGRFDQIQSADLTAALAGRSAVLIPDLEKAAVPSFSDALGTAGRAVLADFVTAGGVLVTVSDSGSRSEALLASLFGYALVRGTAAASYPIDRQAAAGTPFAALGASAPVNNATRPVTMASLPPPARAVYHDSSDPLTDTAAVWAAPVGDGWVASFAWDWFGAAPVGTNDGGLVDALGAALRLAAVPALVCDEADPDGDLVPSCYDLCPTIADPTQLDNEGDGLGDVCDPDDDDDGMPDAWEIGFGLDPLTYDPSLDSDGDGFTNLEEYEGRSNPLLPGSIPGVGRRLDWLWPLLLED
ncbi:MAG: hypothetical protein H6983_11845 [Ectothiorhodospiraceae bacterium]|nr:hypothetical protein [Chromatiales bacterium]MCP5154852.1 hypothetical protein [Ectothiorhodospiraceae bacterium]